MNENTLRNAAANRAIGAALSIMAQASEKDIGRLLDLVTFVAPGTQKGIVRSVKNAWEQDVGIGLLLKRAVTELNPRARRAILADFVIKNTGWGMSPNKRTIFAEEEGFAPPFTSLISPTMRCNLSCAGCYAGDYSQKDELSFELIDRILAEGKDIGIHMATILGGEPFIRPDMWDMYAKHQDVMFMVFTNGTMLDQKAVDRLAQLGNVVPVLSIEGWQGETDARRGKGTFSMLMDTFDRLRAAGVLYGFSATAMRHNIDVICSDEFNDMLVQKGCYFGWHFLYMPIGRNPDLDLMPTAEQRDYMRVNGAARIRETRPLFVADFWNDAPYVGGCIAGGKSYFHINSHGDVEPCIFTHFAVDNIREKSLREVLTSSYFGAIRARQPYDSNLLRPCMLIDHPEVFREVYAQEGPHPTHPDAADLVTTLSNGLDRYAREMGEIMDDAWQRDFVAKGFTPTLETVAESDPARTWMAAGGGN